MSETTAPVVVEGRVKRAYTVTADRPKNAPNTSDLVLRQVSNANRTTGTMTYVVDLQNVTEDYEAEPFALAPTDESEDRWLVVCHDHEFSTTFHTLLEARRQAFLPNLWCSDCAEDVPVVDEFDEDDLSTEIKVRDAYAPSH